MMLSHEGIRATLAAHKAEIAALGVRSLSVFGSVARGEAGEGSDVDFLVVFDGPVTFDRFMDLKILLEDRHGRKIDLVTEGAVRPELRQRIESEARRVA